jgi:hypothetical protein
MGNASSGGLAYVPSTGGGGGAGAAITIGGNTAGVGALVSSGTLSIAGGNNVTLSQNGQSITISGANAPSTAAYYFGGNTTGQSSSSTGGDQTLSYSMAGGISGGWSGGSVILSGPATSSLVGVNGISVSTAGSTISVSGIYQSIYITGNTLGSSSSYYTPGALTISGGPLITIGWSAGSLVFSA